MNKNKHKKKLNLIKMMLSLLVGCACVSVLVLLCLDKVENEVRTNPITNENGVNDETYLMEANMSEQTEEMGESSINLGSGMYITDVKEYSGIYMEDGSDDLVSGIMMIIVENESKETIQYAEIKMPVGEQEAFFKLSTLTPGSTMILLEQNRMEYVPGNYTMAIAENVAVFQEAMSICEDQVEIQMLDGALNVTNISDKDITGDITIYYKNSAEDVFYGGITYRIRIEGGLKKGEIRQTMARHISDSGSTVMFVTCGE